MLKLREGDDIQLDLYTRQVVRRVWLNATILRELFIDMTSTAMTHDWEDFTGHFCVAPFDDDAMKGQWRQHTALL